MMLLQFQVRLFMNIKLTFYVHSVEIAEIFSHLFRKNYVKSKHSINTTYIFHSVNRFTKYFTGERKIDIFPQCVAVPNLLPIFFECVDNLFESA